MVFQLGASLQSLTQYNQFILWRSEHFSGEPKARKIPFNSTTLENADPHQKNIWLTYKEAERLANFHNCGVGFVLTENDPFFCIDLDNCQLPDGTWSEGAKQICNYFAGAAVEISYSGKGLHIFGTSRAFPKHRTRSKNAPGIEVYTTKRFIALGTDPVGDASIDHSAALGSFIAANFPPETVTGADKWTNEPDPEWIGPDDDNELIRRMLASRVSAATAFQGKASLFDLWHKRTVQLAKSYPSYTATGPSFDHSSADMALMMHLAFWTGKNCDRMDRLFRQSKLNRDKWEKRKDYRISTCTEAIARTVKVYQQSKKKELPEPPQTVASVQPNTDIQYRSGYQFLMAPQQAEHFKGCIYIQDIHRVLTSDGSLLRPDQFKAVYGGYDFAIDANSTTTKDAWEVFTQSRIAVFPKAHSVCFRPELSPGAIIDQEGRTLVNTYVPAIIKMKPGDVTPFLQHLEKLIPDQRDRQILLSYIAAVVQYPGVKFQWCPVIQGVEGNGKSLITRCVSKAVGERYTHFPNASDISNKFNAWVQNNLLIVCDEIHFKGNRDIQDALKKLVTDDRVDIQMKGMDQVTGDNRANWIMTTNPRDAVIKSRDGRRYCIFFTAQQRRSCVIRDGMDGRYFPNIYSWLLTQGYEFVSYFLKHYDIPDEFNPATNCHVAPVTTSTLEAIYESKGRAEQEIDAAIEEQRPGFKGGWLSSIALSTLLAERGIKMNRSKQKQMLDEAGYIPHPQLPNGRAPNIVTEEGFRRPKLWIHVSSGLENIHPDEIITVYKVAQGWMQ